MVDTTTIIVGVADGAFEDAFNGLPPWATEDTAVKMEKHLRKSYDINVKIFEQLKKCCAGSGGNKMSPEDIKKVNDELGKLAKNAKKINDEDPKRRKREKEVSDHHKTEQSNWKKTSAILGVLQAEIASVGNLLKKTLLSNVSTFDELYSSGINVMNGFESASSGFEALSQLSTLTGVRFTELSKTIVKYNTAVNSFGLGRFAKTISQTKDSLTQFGYNTKESAELLGAYLESQRGYNDVNAQTQEQTQKNVVKFGERMTKLSQATGVLRAKLIEDVEAISQSVDANILAGRIGNDAAGSMVEFVATFKDKNLGQAFLKMMTGAIKPLNSTFMSFQKTGFGGFGQKLMNLTKSLEGLDPKEAARRTAEFAKAHSAEMQMMVQRGNLLSDAGLKEADEMLKVVTGLQQQGRSYVESSKAEQKKADDTAASSKKIQNEWERLMSQLQQAFTPTIPMLEKFARVLTWVNEKIEAFSKIFDNQTKAWIAVGGIILGTLLGFKLVNAGLNALARKLLETAGGLGSGGGGGGGGNNRGRRGRGGRGGRGARPRGRIPGGIKGSIGGLVAGVTLDIASDQLEKAGHTTAAAATDVASSAASLASMGALIGSVVPVLGTAAGAVIGGIAGAGYGIYQNWDRLGSSSGVNSPSASSISGSTASEDLPKPSDASQVQVPDGAPTPPPPSSTSDINIILTDHGKILRDILEAANSVDRTNKDILKVTRNKA